MSFLLGLKTKAIALGALLLTVAGCIFRLKMVTAQRDRARTAQKSAETERDQVRDTAKADKKIRDERIASRKQTIREVEQGEVPSSLSDDINTW